MGTTREKQFVSSILLIPGEGIPYYPPLCPPTRDAAGVDATTGDFPGVSYPSPVNNDTYRENGGSRRL
eukprot:1194527-Prorocentrum_minimum.AAC.2